MKNKISSFCSSLATLFILSLSIISYPASANVSSLTQTVVTVTGTSALAASQNGNRHYLLIVNRGSVTVVVKFGSVQSGTEGIPIPAGGAYEPSQTPIDSIYAVTESSTADITIIQGQ